MILFNTFVENPFSSFSTSSRRLSEFDVGNAISYQIKALNEKIKATAQAMYLMKITML